MVNNCIVEILPAFSSSSPKATEHKWSITYLLRNLLPVWSSSEEGEDDGMLSLNTYKEDNDY